MTTDCPQARNGSCPVIAIDGGAGTGKTTSARETAARLGFCYIDSGAVYRGLALAAIEAGVTEADDPRVPGIVAAAPLRIDPEPERFRVLLGDRELGDEIRRPEVTSLSSRLAVREDVRDRVTALLRKAGEIGPLVVEGRDIGTVVFPDAALKVFLTADLPVRAQRRSQELQARGIVQDLSSVEADLRERDMRDSSRETSPLRKADDAVVVDTGGTDIAGQVDRIVRAWEDVSGRGANTADSSGRCSGAGRARCPAEEVSPPDRPAVRSFYRFSQDILRCSARLFFGCEIEGIQNVPAHGPLLVAANHKSYLDPVLVGALLPREIRYFAKKELFSVPFFGSLIRWYGAIAVDRSGFDRKAVESALETLRRGEGLLVFPEGTRIRRTGRAEPKIGVGMLAVRSGAPVVPVLLQSTWEPRRNLVRRIPARIRFGAPLSFPAAEPGPEGRRRYGEAAAAIMAAIDALDVGAESP